MIDFYYDRNYRFTKESDLIWIKHLETKGGTSYAVEKLADIPTIKLNDKIHLSIGMAVCSKDDIFNKKLGRDLAISRMKNHTLTVSKIVQEKDSVEVTLTNESFRVILLFKEGKRFSRLDLVEKV